MTPRSPAPHRVAFLGFSDFERSALASYFRLAGAGSPRYVQVVMLTRADFVVADADHLPSVQLVVATDRLADTVFIGRQPPDDAVAWMPRPIDALHVTRELDAMVAARGLLARDAPEQPPASAAAPAPVPAPAFTPASGPTVLERAAASGALHADAGQAAPATAAAPDALPEGPVLMDAVWESAAPDLPPADAAPAAQLPELPEVPDPLAMPGMPATLATPGTPATPATPAMPRALIVDDSPVAQRFLQARLEPWGLAADRAGSSGQAVALMQQHSYDLVFVDLELGPTSELDGLALCQHIKRSASAMHALVIIVSAHHSEMDRVRGALAGCDGYLAKPLNPAELQRLLLRQGLQAPEPEPAV